MSGTEVPIYVYHCGNCLKQTEIFQHFTDDVLTVCPECKQPTLQKVYQVANVHFKGGGWYVKDNYGPDKGGDGIRE